MDSNLKNHFIVIVPGYMGSMLRDKTSGEIVWLDLPALVRNPTRIDDTLNKLKYPNDNLEPAGIMERGVLYALPWAKLDHYGRLIEHLRNAGYAIEPPVHDPNQPAVYPFAYDWRQDNRLSGQQLGEAVRGWRQKHNGAKAWLIGHSNGGIISRWFIEKEGGADDVERLFLMGSPWDGAPKSMRVLFEGYNIVGRRLLNVFGFTKLLNGIIRTFPSYYQLIPYKNPFLRTDLNQDLNPFTELGWLESERDRQFLLDGLKFNQDLGQTLSVDTVCYFGRKKKTTTGGVVSLSPAGKWEKIQWLETEAGDGTVPVHSAVHPQARERHAFAVDHGSIYFQEDVLVQLEFDLAGGVEALEFVTIAVDNLTIEMDTDEDFYAPGELVQVYCTLHDRTKQANPVTDGTVEASLYWYEPLPGDEAAPPEAADMPLGELAHDDGEPGTYRMDFPAPAKEGIYKLRTLVKTRLAKDILAEETLAVEAEPEA